MAPRLRELARIASISALVRRECFFALVQTCVTTSRRNACFKHYCPYYGIAYGSRKNSNPLGHLAPYVAIALDLGHQMTPDETVKSTF